MESNKIQSEQIAINILMPSITIRDGYLRNDIAYTRYKPTPNAERSWSQCGKPGELPTPTPKRVCAKPWRPSSRKYTRTPHRVAVWCPRLSIHGGFGLVRILSMGPVSNSDWLPWTQSKAISTRSWPLRHTVRGTVAKEMASNYRPDLRQIRTADIERSWDTCEVTRR